MVNSRLYNPAGADANRLSPTPHGVDALEDATCRSGAATSRPDGARLDQPVTSRPSATATRPDGARVWRYGACGVMARDVVARDGMRGCGKISANSWQPKGKSRHENRHRRYRIYDPAFVRGPRRRRGMLQGMLPWTDVCDDAQRGPRLPEACALQVRFTPACIVRRMNRQSKISTSL
jgi:hypothetical protein